MLDTLMYKLYLQPLWLLEQASRFFLLLAGCVIISRCSSALFRQRRMGIWPKCALLEIMPKKQSNPPTNDFDKLVTSLRARSWTEFCGQERVKESLSIAIQAAVERGEPMGHTLLYGPPGLGKTTLAHIIAREMKVNIRTTSGPAMERSGDLASILTNLKPGDVLFIDEIHRLRKAIEETLYPAMEDFKLDIVVGKGPSARILRLDVPPFCLVGATTRAGLLSSPLRERFSLIHRLNFYNPEDLARIIENGAEKLNVHIDDQATLELAKRARGTPRAALKLLKRVRDVAQVRAEGEITEEVLEQALEILKVDELGLDEADRRLLKALIEKHGGGPAGLSTLAATISEDEGTIEDVLEPYLMQIGFIKRTPRGRVATPRAYKHLGIPYSENPNQQKIL